MLGVLVVWQLAAAFTVQIDVYDGYDTVVNANYFAGLQSTYVYNRSPLMGFVLAPVEMLRQALAFHPLDVRPHHLATGILHIIYLVGVYVLLVRQFGTTPANVFAYGATIPTFVFFSYAPFISHDILPGGIFLWMLLLSHKYAEYGGSNRLVLLAVLGAAAPLIKPTYALFWIAILCAHAYVSIGADRAWHRLYLIKLFGAAVLSAVIVWVATIATLGYAFPDSPLWMKPYFQARFLLDEAAGSTAAPWWIYLRNAPAYGVIPMLLIIPGVAMALRRDRLIRTIAVAWVVSLVVMALLSQREVRYLAFLAPLSTFLIVEPLHWILSDGRKAMAAGGLLGLSLMPVNPYSPLSEAARVFTPFYRNEELREFLAPLEKGPAQPTGILMNTKLGVVAPRDSPLIGDPYARLFLLSLHHVAMLFGYDLNAVRFVSDNAFKRVDGWPASTAVIWSSSHPFLKRAAWTSIFVPRDPAPTLTLAICEEVRWRFQSRTTLITASGGVANLDAVTTTHGTRWVLSGEVLEREIAHLDVELRVDAPGSFDARRLVIESPHQYRIEGPVAGIELPPGSVLRIRGFDIKRIFAPPQDDA